MAQSVKRPIVSFGSGHYLTVCGFEPRVRVFTVSTEPAEDSLSPSLSLPLPGSFSLSLSLSLSLKRNKLKKKTGKRFEESKSIHK